MQVFFILGHNSTAIITFAVKGFVCKLKMDAKIQ